MTSYVLNIYVCIGSQFLSAWSLILNMCVSHAFVMHSVLSCSETSLIRHSIGPENNVDYRRLLDYAVPLTILMYGDCTSYDGPIRENVGLKRCQISKVSL